MSWTQRLVAMVLTAAILVSCATEPQPEDAAVAYWVQDHEQVRVLQTDQLDADHARVLLQFDGRTGEKGLTVIVPVHREGSTWVVSDTRYKGRI